MDISIRRAAGMFALAFTTLASGAAAQVGETGKLRLTGGVNTVDGVAGGGLTPWAVIGSNASADQVGAAPFGTVVKSKDYQLGTAGAAVGIRDRVEVSFARQDFDTMATGTALGLPNLHLKQNIYGVKVKLSGNAILNQDTWLPQMAAGILYKDLDAGGLAPTLTALGADDHGADFYVSATKLLLARSFLVNGTVRFTKANQNGLLGFGGTAQDDYRPMAEGSIAILLRKDLAVGGEYRMKPDNLNPSILGAGLKEDDWHDMFIAYAPTKNISVTAAYVGLGKIVPAVQSRTQSGFYLSGQVSF